MRKLFVAAAAATALVVVQAHTGGAQMRLPAPDQQFMLEAARAGIAEVELGRLAAQRAASDAVRSFAQRMVTDHGAANEELARLARSKGVALPSEMGPAHRATLDRLAGMSGPAFDQAYMGDMMKAHQQTSALFTRETREGQDAEVRAWAMKRLPGIQEHLRLAYDTHSRVAQVPAGQAPVVAVPPPPPVPAASPATTTTVVTTTVAPVPPFCGGAYLPGVGTNFGSCVAR
jgi:putative membrane protein